MIDKQKKLLIDSLANKLKIFKKNGIKEVNKKNNNFNSWEKHITTNNTT